MKRLLFFILSITPLCSFAQNIITVSGGGVGGGTDGLGDDLNVVNAKFGNFAGLAVDKSGDLFIADKDNNRIRKIDFSTGIITSIAGTGVAGFSGDNGLATNAQLNDPGFIVFDTSGVLYISDRANNRIRRVSVNGIITTIAGNGNTGYNGDTIPALQASIWGPEGITIDKSGNLYIADNNNHRIRKVNNSGIITTVAGNGTSGYSGDNGIAMNAEVVGIYGLCNDTTGNLYVADWSGNRVRKVDYLTNIITTVAGNGTPGFSGDNGLADTAKVNGPFNVFCDDTGNVYIADESNNRIREIKKSTGQIITVAGNGTTGYSGDGGLADTAELNRPAGGAIDYCHNLYIADNQNKRIRKVLFDTACSSLGDTSTYIPNLHNATLNLYPNPATTQLTITTPGNINAITILNTLGQIVYENKQRYSNKTVINISALPVGLYLVKLDNGLVQRFLKE